MSSGRRRLIQMGREWAAGVVGCGERSAGAPWCSAWVRHGFVTVLAVGVCAVLAEARTFTVIAVADWRLASNGKNCPEKRRTVIDASVGQLRSRA